MGFLLRKIINHRSGRRSFRGVYPAELRPFVAGSPWEYKVSLGHPEEADFLKKYEAAKQAFEKSLDTARRKRDGHYDALTAPRIAYLTEVFRADELEADNEARWSPEERELFENVGRDLAERGHSGAVNWSGDPRRRWAEKAKETSAMMLDVYRDLLAIGDLAGIVAMWREEVDVLLEVEGLVVDPNASDDYAQLCLAINRTAIEVAEVKLRRLAGADEPTPSRPPAPSELPGAPKASSLPIMATYNEYATAQRMTAGVEEETRRYVQHLIDYLGHDDASRITADNLREWRDLLLNTPTRQGKPRKPVTVRDKYISPIRAMLNWAVQERRLATNVAAEVAVRVPKEAKLRDRDFTEAEAKAILAATLQPVTRRLSDGYIRAQRWIPWLCAYTGGRVNEFSQLRGQDVREIDGIWTVRITPEAGTVKAKEARVVPLHPHLIDQGFVKMVLAQGDGPLFFDPDRQRVDGKGNRHFKKVGERLAAWVRNEVGITDPALQPNHAWRHTFKSRSYDAGIEERIADAIQGHAPLTTGRRYGKPSLKALDTAIRRLPRYAVG